MYTSSPTSTHVTHPAHTMTHRDQSGHPGTGTDHHILGQTGHCDHDRQGGDPGMFNGRGGEGSETP